MNKVIHYCWFGGNPLGEKELNCIESWKKYFPGYEIRRWDETNFDVGCCDYVAEAYDAKKWAFVSDYARFAILYEHGGLYFDTDVEVIRSFDDVLENGPFMGLETDPGPEARGGVAPGLGLAANPGLGLAANPGLGLYKFILDSYKTDHFVKLDGSLNLRTVVERVTDLLLLRGLTASPGIQVVDGVSIFPAEYFNPTDLETGEVRVTENTHSIHHYDASWQPQSLRRVGEIKQRLKRSVPRVPSKIRSAVAWIIYMANTGDIAAFRNRY